MKNHSCEFCQKSFSQVGSLKTHIKMIHDGHKDQNCDICCKRFSTKKSTNKTHQKCPQQKYLLESSSKNYIYNYREQ